MDLTQGGDHVFQVAKGMWEDVESTAKQMLASDLTIAPMLSPDGNPMFYITTDKSLLSLSFMSVDMNGTRVFGGMRA